MCLFQFCFPQGMCPVVGLLGHMVVLFLVFQGISRLFSIVAVSIYIPPTVQEGSLSSTPSPAPIVYRFFVDGHSDQCEVIAHYSFDLIFSNNEQCWASFHVFSTWVWVNSGSWWWTGRPGVLQFMGSQRVGHNWATELNWTELNNEQCWASFMCLLW